MRTMKKILLSISILSAITAVAMMISCLIEGKRYATVVKFTSNFDKMYQ